MSTLASARQGRRSPRRLSDFSYATASLPCGWRGFESFTNNTKRRNSAMRLDHIFNPLQIMNATAPAANAINDELKSLQTKLELHIATGPEKISGLPASTANFLSELESAERKVISAYRTPLVDACNLVADLGSRYVGAALEADGESASVKSWCNALVASLDAALKKHGCKPCGGRAICPELAEAIDKAERFASCAEFARSAAAKLPKHAAAFANALSGLIADPRRGRPLKIESANSYSTAHESGGGHRIGYSATV